VPLPTKESNKVKYRKLKYTSEERKGKIKGAHRITVIFYTTINNSNSQ
jgi:hypothetical protein